MTRRTIGGHLDSSALALLAELHKPSDAAALARKCARLVAGGLSINDVGHMLNLSSAAVADLLDQSTESAGR